MKQTIKLRGAMVLGIILCTAAAYGHAFLDHADPKVGSTTQPSPKEVRAWFTEAIKPDVSTLKVFDAAGKEVDAADVHVDPKDDAQLAVSVPSLPAGEYKVEWSVVTSDTHRTHGTFKFSVGS